MQLGPVAYSHGFLWNLTKSDSLLLKFQVLESHGSLSLFLLPLRMLLCFSVLDLWETVCKQEQSVAEQKNLGDSLLSYCTVW